MVCLLTPESVSWPPQGRRKAAGGDFAAVEGSGGELDVVAVAE